MLELLSNANFVSVKMNVRVYIYKNVLLFLHMTYDPVLITSTNINMVQNYELHGIFSICLKKEDY